MNKRKLLLLASVLCIAAILAVGSTLAYFTDEGKATNVFTMGSINIDLEETFDEETADLFPGLDINKDVWVENIGESDAYVRVHIGIPAKMDDGDPNFNAVNNFLHFNFDSESVAEGQWSWGTTASPAVPGANGTTWNFYTTNLNGEPYNVYVVTYTSVLEPGKATATYAMTKVYLDKSVDAVENEDGTITYFDINGNKFTMAKDDKVQIEVFAEATQTETFTDAFDALNTAFGDPRAAGYVDPWNK